MKAVQARDEAELKVRKEVDDKERKTVALEGGNPDEVLLRRDRQLQQYRKQECVASVCLWTVMCSGVALHRLSSFPVGVPTASMCFLFLLMHVCTYICVYMYFLLTITGSIVLYLLFVTVYHY